MPRRTTGTEIAATRGMLIVNDGYEVKFAPPLGSAIAMALAHQPAATIQASGYGTQTASAPLSRP